MSNGTLQMFSDESASGGNDGEGRRARLFCFTLNNYSESDEANLKSKFESNLFTWLVYGRETAPSTGTLHLQGAFHTKAKYSFNRIRVLLDNAHISVRFCNGNAEQNRAYCIKEGNFEEFGVMPKDTGLMEKERWALAKKYACAGELEKIPDDLYVRYYPTFKKIKFDHMPTPKSLEMLPGVWISGRPGIGKSLYAKRRFPGAFSKPLNKWWDGYTCQKSVIIEEISPEQSTWIGTFLKIWVDFDPFLAETKGGTICVRPRYVVVVSNYTFDEVFAEKDQSLMLAIKRRFSHYDFNNDVIRLSLFEAVGLSPTFFKTATVDLATMVDDGYAFEGSEIN